MKLHPLIPLLIGCGAAAAQTSAAETSPARSLKGIDVQQMTQEIAGNALHHASLQVGGERIVKGAPYCAEAVHEQVQWLADPNGGAPNRVSNKQTTRLCRDGEGRTHQEVERGGRKLVHLRDPLARENWTLDPERKTARASGLASWPDDSAMREYAERMREWARGVAERVRAGSGATPALPAAPATPPTPPSPPSPAVITFGPGGEREFDVRVMRFDGGMADLPPPPMNWSLRSLQPRGPGVTTPLPAKEIEGLRVNGERTSWTIEAGKVGNDKPIQIFREVWTSPELMLTVMSRDFDPRSAEVVYRLQNLKRGEPDAALMRVPPDYSTPRRAERGERK